MNPVAVVRSEVDYTSGKLLGESIWLWCPACDTAKRLPINRTDGSTSWDFDGNLEKPTLSPSILQHSSGVLPQCHSFLRAGVWEFLGDCEHEWAGQKLDAVPLPDWLVAE